MNQRSGRGPQLPIGTTVIDPRGRVGQVESWLGGDEYEVRYADGAVARWTGNALHLQKRSQRDLLTMLPPRDGMALVERGLIYRAVTGSRIYGLETEGSDTDIRGVFVCPAEEYLDVRWQLDPLQSVRPNSEEQYWEIGRLVWLALKADPNTLECLWSPEVLHLTPEGERLIAARSSFLSRHAFSTYGGYVLSQLRRLRADLRQGGDPNWKHAMHLARLLVAGTALLRHGDMRLEVGDLRERLLAIKCGAMDWDAYEAWRMELQTEFDRALETTPLPDRPDVEGALALVLELRTSTMGARRASAEVHAAVRTGVDARVVDAAASTGVDPRVVEAAAALGERLVFATVSGAHLYGFASPDSDWDLRACHALPVTSFAGLRPDGPDERRLMSRADGFELDLVSTEVGKFAAMLLKRNGYVLEQVLSPVLVVSGPEHEELRALARRCPTVNHAHHYLGFLASQIREAERRGTVKALLYCVRVALTGMWLMSTGEVEANLPRLAQLHADELERRGIAVGELIERKAAGGERTKLGEGELDAWRDRLAWLGAALEAARDASRLPVEPPEAVRRELDAFVRGARMRSGRDGIGG